MQCALVSTHELEMRVPPQNEVKFNAIDTAQPHVLSRAVVPPRILDLITGLVEQPQDAVALQRYVV